MFDCNRSGIPPSTAASGWTIDPRSFSSNVDNLIVLDYCLTTFDNKLVCFCSCRICDLQRDDFSDGSTNQVHRIRDGQVHYIRAVYGDKIASWLNTRLVSR